MLTLIHAFFTTGLPRGLVTIAAVLLTATTAYAQFKDLEECQIIPEEAFVQRGLVQRGLLECESVYFTKYKCRQAIQEPSKLNQHTVGAAYLSRAERHHDAATKHLYRQKAVYWHQKAAVQGYPSSQYALAKAYLQEIGLEQNVKAGMCWLNRAADSNYELAKEWLKDIEDQRKARDQQKAQQ